MNLTNLKELADRLYPTPQLEGDDRSMVNYHYRTLVVLQIRAAFIKGWLEANRWIDVTEQLPEMNEPILWYNDANERVPSGLFEANVWAYDPEKGRIKAKYDNCGWREVSSNSISGCRPTHWLPMAPPPEQKPDNNG